MMSMRSETRPKPRRAGLWKPVFCLASVFVALPLGSVPALAAPFGYVTNNVNSTVSVIDAATNPGPLLFIAERHNRGHDSGGDSSSRSGRHPGWGARLCGEFQRQHGLGDCDGHQHGHQHGHRHDHGGVWSCRSSFHPGWGTRLYGEFFRQHGLGDRYGQQHRDGNDSRAGFSLDIAFQPASPSSQINGLIAKVQALVNAGVLNGGQGNSLIVTLNHALRYLPRQPQQAISQLQVFIGKVNTLISGGVLTQAQGQPLINSANSIIHQLGG